MTKKDFIALANLIKESGKVSEYSANGTLDLLARFCQSTNPNFKRDRWLDYIDGKCGPNGGAVK